MPLKYFNQDKDDVITKVFSELKILGVKVPKVKKFKTNTVKQEKCIQETGCKIFGVNLSDQEWTSEGETSIPKFIALATAYLCKYSKKEVGIFRKAGNVLRQKKLRLQLENGGNLEGAEPNDVACLFKQWLREMPDPLIPPTLQDIFIRCLSLDIEENCVTACLLTCFLLSPDHLRTLKHLLCFLKDIAADSDKNKMSVYNLSLIMAPNIFAMRDHSNKIQNNSVQQYATIVKILIDNADRIGEIPAGIAFQYSFFGSELDSSSDLLDCNANRSKKKRKSGGTVQDIFSGFKKLVGQNGTPVAAKTPENDLKIPAFPRSASKRKADPDQRSLSAVKKQAVSLDGGLDSPSLAITPKQKGLYLSNAEKDSNRHVRRKSIGALLRRKDRKRNKSSKLPQSDVCSNLDICAGEKTLKLDKTTAEHLFEKCSPLYKETKQVTYSGSIKKSVSDCYLPVVKNEFSVLPIISVSSSQGCLPNRPIRTSQYNLRSETLSNSLEEENLLGNKAKSENAEKQNKRKSSKNENIIEKGLDVDTTIKPKIFQADSFSLEDIHHVDTFPQPTCIVMDESEDSGSKKEICNDSSEHLLNGKIISLDLSSRVETSVAECNKTMICTETKNLNQVTATSKNFTNAEARNIVEETISNKLGLTRQEGFIVKNKSKSSAYEKSVNNDQKSRSMDDKCTTSQNGDKQILTTGSNYIENATAERKSLKRKTRHGSLMRGQPNSVKSGLRSEAHHRYSNDSAFLLESSPSLSIDQNVITFRESNDKSNLIESSPPVLSLDLSLSIILQNFCISSPVNSPEISLGVDVVSKENNSPVKLSISSNEEKNLSHITDPSCRKFSEITPELPNRKRLSSKSDSDINNLKKLSGGNKLNSSRNTSGNKRKNSRTKMSSVHSSESFSTDVENSLSCKENQVFDDNCFKTPNNKLCSPDSITWISGSSFLSSISSPQDEVTNKRESIAMILKNNTGHVQAKVSLYDNQLQNTSVSSSTKKECSKERVLRSSSQKCHSGSRKKVSTSISYDSGTRSNSVKHKLRCQRSPLPPPPKFTLTDFSTPSPKTSQPLKEVTNLNMGLDDTKLASPNKAIKRSTPIKQKNSPPEFTISTRNSGSRTKKNKRNSFSGYTPYKMPQKVSRSESSPAFQRKEILIHN